MKVKLLICVIFGGLTIYLNAQTLYVPSGTNGIENNSTNGNVLIGSFNNTNNLKLSIPGVYNFEQVNLGQFGNGACGLEFINHTSVNPSYGVRLFANVDQTPGLQIQTSNSVNSYNDLAYSTRMFISLNGNIGIGTTTPTSIFLIQNQDEGSSIAVQSTYSGNKKIFEVTQESSDGFLYLRSANGVTYTKLSGYWNSPSYFLTNVGIGTTSPSHPLTVKPLNDIDAISWRRSIDGNEVGRLGVTGSGGTGRYGWMGLWNATGIQTFQIDAGGGNSYLVSGNVGIGTTTPQNKLDVNGTIRAKEVKVETGWADFVFTPTYKLRPLSEVEQFIKTNGHLPEIPKAEDVQQNGVNLGEMQTKLLQKVEELTLYSIELEKIIKDQNKRIIELEKNLKNSSLFNSISDPKIKN